MMRTANNKAPANSTGFPTLSEQFVSAYAEFDERFRLWATARRDNLPVFLMFGTSGAGKTTLMARIATSMPPDEFMGHLTSRSRDNYTHVENFTIGHSALKSTTLIPRPHTITAGVTPLHVFDMPGFHDYDADRRIVIDVLHKCLLTRVKAVKFIVVLGIEALASKVPAKSVLEYCEAFEKLFGDRYASCIQHVYFVLTKNDTVGLKEAEVMRSMFHLMQGAGSLANAALNMFVSRLTTNHVVVDYSEEGDEKTRKRLVEMVERDNMAQELQVNALNITGLQAQEENLTIRCEEELVRLKETVVEQQRRVKGAGQQALQELEGLEKTAEEQISHHMKEVREATADYAEVARLNKALATYSTEHANLSEAKVANESQVKFCEEQLQLMDTTINGFENVSYRCDVATIPTGLTKTRYAVDLTIAMSHQMAANHIVLVTEFEADDRTLASHIVATEGGSRPRAPLQPKSIETIRSFANPKYVLHHSTNNFNAFGRNDGEGVRREGDQLIVNLRFDRQFKVFVYHAVKFSETAAYDGLKDHLSRNLATAKAGVETTTIKLRALDTQNATNLKKRADLNQQLKGRGTALQESVMTMNSLIASVATLWKVKAAAIEALREVADPATYPVLGHVHQIDAIYAANNLRSDLRVRCQDIQLLLDAIRETVVQTLTGLQRMSVAVTQQLQTCVKEQPVIPEGLRLPHM